jgi:hypothetical protein
MSLKYQGGYTGNRPAWGIGRQPGVWSLYDRFTKPETVTKQVTVAASTTVVDAIELPSPCLVLAVRLSRASWIRFYDSTPRAEADASRLVTVDPPAGGGVHLEIRTSGDNRINTAPVAYLVNREPGDSVSYPFRLTNESGQSDVTVEVTYYPLLSFA